MYEPIVYPKPPLPIIDKEKYRLPENQYVPERVDKTGIVLHHTVSSSIDSVYNWWLEKGQSRAVRVGTAYVIDKQGRIYEFFPDDMWAWHLGKGVENEDEKRTIGIEIISEGALVRENEDLLAFYNPKTGRGFAHKEDFVDLGRMWRGYRYFDSYSIEQIRAVIVLTDYLFDKYDIPRRAHSDLWTFNPNLKKFEGLISHAQIRADKTDVHPLFPIKDIAKWTKMELINNE